MKVSAALTGRPDQYGRKRIYIRVAQGNSQKYKATEMRVLPSQFKDGKVIGLPNSKQFNDKIKTIILQIEYKKVFGSDDQVEDFSFREYARDCLVYWEKNKKEGTMRQNMTEFNKFLAFAGNEVMLSKIGVDLLNDYLAHLYSLGNTENTAWKSFKFVRKVIRRAWKQGKKKDYPFDVFEFPKYTAPKRDYLTDDELCEIHKIADNKNATPEVRFVANWFLIGCYTALRFSDWQQFDKKKHIVNNRLVLYTTKTGEMVSMPLVDQTRKLFKAVNYQGMHYSNPHVNRVLKDIDKGAGIGKEISAHLSRHTFGVRAASVMTLESCARIMGITVRVCQVYYKIVDKVSDKEYHKLWE